MGLFTLIFVSAPDIPLPARLRMTDTNCPPPKSKDQATEDVKHYVSHKRYVNSQFVLYVVHIRP